MTVSFVEYAMKSRCSGRAMHERGLLWWTGHFAAAGPVGASNFTGMSASTRGSLLSLANANGFVGGYCDAIALREYFAAINGAVVGKCEHLFAGCNIPDSGGAVQRCHEESSRARSRRQGCRRDPPSASGPFRTSLRPTQTHGC